MIHLNLIRKSPEERLRSYLDQLIADNPRNGEDRAVFLWSQVFSLVHNSFIDDAFPVSLYPTSLMVQDRLSLCVDAILEMKELGWTSIRISNELPRYFGRKMRAEKYEHSKRKSWGDREDTIPLVKDDAI